MNQQATDSFKIFLSPRKLSPFIGITEERELKCFQGTLNSGILGIRKKYPNVFLLKNIHYLDFNFIKS